MPNSFRAEAPALGVEINCEVPAYYEESPDFRPELNKTYCRDLEDHIRIISAVYQMDTGLTRVENYEVVGTCSLKSARDGWLENKRLDNLLPPPTDDEQLLAELPAPVPPLHKIVTAYTADEMERNLNGANQRGWEPIFFTATMDAGGRFAYSAVFRTVYESAEDIKNRRYVEHLKKF